MEPIGLGGFTIAADQTETRRQPLRFVDQTEWECLGDPEDELLRVHMLLVGGLRRVGLEGNQVHRVGLVKRMLEQGEVHICALIGADARRLGYIA